MIKVPTDVMTVDVELLDAFLRLLGSRGKILSRRYVSDVVGDTNVSRAGNSPFPDAKLSEIWEAELQLLDSLGAGNVVFGITRLALLLDTTHFRSIGLKSLRSNGVVKFATRGR